jgi:apolipoprotein N-acyltransferase
MRSGLARLLVALGAGVLHALSFAPRNLPWLQLLALATLFALSTRVERRALRPDSVCFGLGWCGVGGSWVYIACTSTA